MRNPWEWERNMYTYNRRHMYLFFFFSFAGNKKRFDSLQIIGSDNDNHWLKLQLTSLLRCSGESGMRILVSSSGLQVMYSSVEGASRIFCKKNISYPRTKLVWNTQILTHHIPYVLMIINILKIHCEFTCVLPERTLHWICCWLLGSHCCFQLLGKNDALETTTSR